MDDDRSSKVKSTKKKGLRNADSSTDSTCFYQVLFVKIFIASLDIKNFQ